MKYRHTCHICGKLFDSSQPASKFCSPECRYKGKIERNRQYKKEHHDETVKSMFINEIVKDKCIPFVNTSHLVRDNARARLAGVSYGMYMAKKRRANETLCHGVKG